MDDQVRVLLEVAGKKPQLQDQDHGNGNSEISAVSITPVVVALVSLLVILFLLVSYYRVLASCYKSWIAGNSGQEQLQRQQQHPVAEISSGNSHAGNQEQQQQQQQALLIRSSALSKSLIQRLPVRKNSDRSLQGDCAVCLGDFQQGEDVKVLPKCGHGFHVECIDTWLSSHSNVCPLCRAQVEDPKIAVVSIDPLAEVPVAVENGAESDHPGSRTIRAENRRKMSSSLDEGSVLFRSLLVRFSRTAPENSSASSSVEAPPAPQPSGMRRSWSSSRVFSIRRNRQQYDQQQQQQQQEPC